MTAPPGSGFVGIAKGSQGFFRRWGAKANFRAMGNLIHPVAVVDTYRGDESGSMRAITGESFGNPAQHPSIIFSALADTDGVTRVEVEVHQMAVWVKQVSDLAGAASIRDIHIFSPVAPYNPILNLNPVGFFVPGLNLDPAFTLGRVVMIGGSNPNLPFDLGYFLSHATATRALTFGQPRAYQDDFAPGVDALQPQPTLFQKFDPPLRLPAGRGQAITLALQWITSKPPFPALNGMRWTVLYNERFISD